MPRLLLEIPSPAAPTAVIIYGYEKQPFPKTTTGKVPQLRPLYCKNDPHGIQVPKLTMRAFFEICTLEFLGSGKPKFDWEANIKIHSTWKWSRSISDKFQETAIVSFIPSALVWRRSSMGHNCNIQIIWDGCIGIRRRCANRQLTV